MVIATRPVRRTRDNFTVNMVAEWKKATQEDEQRQWRAELETLSSLSSYRLFKRRLELELYLQDEGSRMSVSGRCAAREMARLRCGTNDLAISTGRRHHQAGHKVPFEQRACEWCKAWLQRPASVELRQLRPPVESGEHVLLACGLYRKLRMQLFTSVRDITSGRDADGRTVLSSGPVSLADMISTDGAAGGTSGRKSAMAVVSGGLFCRRELNPRRSKADRCIDLSVRQVCKRYVGAVMACRRRWQLRQVRSMTRPGADNRQSLLQRRRWAPRLVGSQRQLSLAGGVPVVNSNMQSPVRESSRHTAVTLAARLRQQSSTTRMTRALRHQTNIVPYLLLSPSWSSASPSGAKSSYVRLPRTSLWAKAL